MNKTEKIVVVLANTPRTTSHRDGLLYELFKTYVSDCKKNNQTVTIIDLADFNLDYSNETQNKNLIQEYQIKLKYADKIVLFHPVVWSLPTADVKLFIDKIFVSGFAFNTSKKITYGLFAEKTLHIIGMTELPLWQEMFLSNNSLSYFWKRIFAKKCGFGKTQLTLIPQFRSLTEKQIQYYKDKLQKTTQNETHITSLLELF